MVGPRYGRILGLFLIVIGLLSAAMMRLGWEWKQALNNVDQMIVAPVTLPTYTPIPKPDGTGEDVPARLQPTAEPTMIPEPDGPINILLMGTDARPGEQISRTDAIILVHIDSRASQVSMLSFPRDLWVEIPGYGEARINAAYPIGEEKFGPGYGPALAKETVSKLVGMPVQHYIMINFEGFKTLIDKLDGIYIDVPKPIDDPKYPRDEYEGDLRTIKVHFDAGYQRMNGERALIYARTRHADSDFGRNQRQQQVLMAIFDRVREQGLLSQLTNLDDYTAALRDYVRTDMSRADMLSLARVATRFAPDDVQRYAIDSAMLINLQKPATFAAEPGAMKRLVDQIVGGSSAPAGGEDPSSQR